DIPKRVGGIFRDAVGHGVKPAFACILQIEHLEALVLETGDVVQRTPCDAADGIAADDPSQDDASLHRVPRYLVVVIGGRECAHRTPPVWRCRASSLRRHARPPPSRAVSGST